MPIESVLFLGLVIGALTFFASTLAYGDWITRHDVIDPATKVRQAEKAKSSRPPAANSFLDKAA